MKPGQKKWKPPTVLGFLLRLALGFRTPLGNTEHFLLRAQHVTSAYVRTRRHDSNDLLSVVLR